MLSQLLHCPTRHPTLFQRAWWRQVGYLALVLVMATPFAAGAEPTQLVAGAGPAQLVKDLTPTSYQAGFSIPSGSYYYQPSTIVDIGGTAFFAAWDAVNGTELWKSDRTVEGTSLVADIRPGAGDSGPTDLTNVGGTLFFTANDGSSGPELWKSDGTPAGTYKVIDLVPGAQGASLLTDVAGRLFFAASDSDGSMAVWRSDGTPEGTVRIRGGFPATHPKLCYSGIPSRPYRVPSLSSFTDASGMLFFIASDESTGAELWKSDGTPEGTLLVKDIRPGSESAFSVCSATRLANMGGILFFAADDGTTGAELWKSDGTADGTMLVKDLNPGSIGAAPSKLLDAGGTLFFTAGFTTRQLWKSDGTVDGTVPIKDIDPDNLIDMHGTLFFTAMVSRGYQLWRSDGTPAGTVLVKPIGSISSVTQAGDILFLAHNDISGSVLWASDGTTAGTVIIPVYTPDTPSAYPLANLTNVGGRLLFSVGERGTYDLWQSDGTAAGTLPIKLSNAELGSSGLAQLTRVRDTLFFAKDEGIRFLDYSAIPHGSLWQSRGSSDTTTQVKGPMPNLAQLTDLNGNLLFVTSVMTGEVWRTDSATASTELVSPLNANDLTNINGELFFGVGSTLWKSDGTPSGTTAVKEITDTNGFLSPWIAGLTGAGKKIFFAAIAGFCSNSGCYYNYALWVSDGTAQGTYSIKPFEYLTDLTNVNGTLFFAASEQGVYTLWTSDGTVTGTHPIILSDTPITGAPAQLIAVGNTLFFTLSDHSNGRELWKSDGTAAGTVLVKDIQPGLLGSQLDSLTVVGDRLFFTANDGAHGRELWISDGTAAGTAIVKDIRPGVDGSVPSHLTNINGTLIFSASDGHNGVEPWRSDGSPDGTMLIQDIAPGPANSNPANFTFAGINLFFTANDGVSGQELWALYSLTVEAHHMLLPVIVR